ncbi:MAG: hypothetical protein LCI03_01595 [Actinobacteria bacterium]|jgi:hypothetical protein|nr:hypothetical protein [Actinomycetota bacterium]
MRLTSGTRPHRLASARFVPAASRVITGPGQKPTWRPPVRLVGWLELLRGVTPLAA